MKMKSFAVAALGTAMVAGAGSALAQGGGVTFDPAEAIAIADSAKAFIIAVGTAVLVMLMVAKGIRWARKAG